MSTTNILISGFERIKELGGKQIRLRYFNQSIGSVYDDDLTLTQSGSDYWTSGVVMPLKQFGRMKSTDQILVEQGLISPSDQKLYVDGDLKIAPETGSINQLKIGLGSPVPNGQEYAVLELGATEYEVSNTPIYKIVYIRQLTTGSYIGE